MTYERHYLVGMTDYTGVSLHDILDPLRQWERVTDKAVTRLNEHLIQVRRDKERLKNAKEVVNYCLFFQDLFGRYLFDIRRLIKELPAGVKEGHVEIVRQLFQSAKSEDDVCVRFKNDWVYKSLPDESMRPLLDRIYADTRDILMDYRDFSNLVPRLKTFVGDEPPREVLNDFHLKPNFFGVGVNLNRIFARVRDWRRSRKSS